MCPLRESELTVIGPENRVPLWLTLLKFAVLPAEGWGEIKAGTYPVGRPALSNLLLEAH